MILQLDWTEATLSVNTIVFLASILFQIAGFEPTQHLHLVLINTSANCEVKPNSFAVFNSDLPRTPPQFLPSCGSEARVMEHGTNSFSFRPLKLLPSMRKPDHMLSQNPCLGGILCFCQFKTRTIKVGNCKVLTYPLLCQRNVHSIYWMSVSAIDNVFDLFTTVLYVKSLNTDCNPAHISGPLTLVAQNGFQIANFLKFASFVLKTHTNNLVKIFVKANLTKVNDVTIFSSLNRCVSNCIHSTNHVFLRLQKRYHREETHEITQATFVLENLDTFRRREQYLCVRTFSMYLLVSDIISVTVSTSHIASWNKSVDIAFSHQFTKKSKEGNSLECVFWDATAYRWSGRGCRTLFSNASHTFCHCDHLTSFAVLMNVARGPEIADDEDQTLLTQIGCCLSVIFLTLTLATYKYFGNLKGRRTTIHSHLTTCLLLGHSLFLIGQLVRDFPLVCALITVGTHYAFLCVFFWMFLEGLELVYLFAHPLHHQSIKESVGGFTYTVGYIVPVFILFLSVLMLKENYLADGYCWLNHSKGAIWSFVAPAIVILTINSFVMAFTVYIMIAHSHTSGTMKHRSVFSKCRIWIKGTSILVCVLGTCWAIGILDLSQNTTIFSYIFVATNSTQGVAIFIFHCVLNKKVRFEYYRALDNSPYVPNFLKPKLSQTRSVSAFSKGKSRRKVLAPGKSKTTTTVKGTDASGKRRAEAFNMIFTGWDLDHAGSDSGSDESLDSGIISTVSIAQQAAKRRNKLELLSFMKGFWVAGGSSESKQIAKNKQSSENDLEQSEIEKYLSRRRNRYSQNTIPLTALFFGGVGAMGKRQQMEAPQKKDGIEPKVSATQDDQIIATEKLKSGTPSVPMKDFWSKFFRPKKPDKPTLLVPKAEDMKLDVTGERMDAPRKSESPSFEIVDSKYAISETQVQVEKAVDRRNDEKEIAEITKATPMQTTERSKKTERPGRFYKKFVRFRTFADSVRLNVNLTRLKRKLGFSRKGEDKDGEKGKLSAQEVPGTTQQMQGTDQDHYGAAESNLATGRYKKSTITSPSSLRENSLLFATDPQIQNYLFPSHFFVENNDSFTAELRKKSSEETVSLIFPLEDSIEYYTCPPTPSTSLAGTVIRRTNKESQIHLFHHLSAALRKKVRSMSVLDQLPSTSKFLRSGGSQQNKSQNLNKEVKCKTSKNTNLPDAEKGPLTYTGTASSSGPSSLAPSSLKPILRNELSILDTIYQDE